VLPLQAVEHRGDLPRAVDAALDHRQPAGFVEPAQRVPKVS
jgi:hypothetical protein